MYDKLVKVNDEMKDHWAVVRNYEGILNVYKKSNEHNVEKYLQIMDKMAPRYKLEEAEMNFINLMKDQAEAFSEAGDPAAGKRIYTLLFKHLDSCQEEVGRPEAVFAFVSLLIKDKQYKECIDILTKENDFFKKTNPKSVKRNTYAIDCVLLALLMDDSIMAERFLEKYSDDIEGFYSSRDALFCEKVINAFKSKNQEDFDKVMNGTIAASVFPATIISTLRKLKLKNLSAGAQPNDIAPQTPTPKQAPPQEQKPAKQEPMPQTPKEPKPEPKQPEPKQPEQTPAPQPPTPVQQEAQPPAPTPQIAPAPTAIREDKPADPNNPFL